MEPRRRDQQRPARGDGVKRAKRTFVHAEADDYRGQPDQLGEMGGGDRLRIGRQRSIGGEELRVVGGPTAFDFDEGVEQPP